MLDSMLQAACGHFLLELRLALDPHGLMAQVLKEPSPACHLIVNHRGPACALWHPMWAPRPFAHSNDLSAALADCVIAHLPAPRPAPVLHPVTCRCLPHPCAC